MLLLLHDLRQLWWEAGEKDKDFIPAGYAPRPRIGFNDCSCQQYDYAEGFSNWKWTLKHVWPHHNHNAFLLRYDRAILHGWVDPSEDKRSWRRIPRLHFLMPVISLFWQLNLAWIDFNRIVKTPKIHDPLLCLSFPPFALRFPKVFTYSTLFYLIASKASIKNDTPTPSKQCIPLPISQYTFCGTWWPPFASSQPQSTSLQQTYLIGVHVLQCMRSDATSF